VPDSLTVVDESDSVRVAVGVAVGDGVGVSVGVSVSVAVGATNGSTSMLTKSIPVKPRLSVTCNTSRLAPTDSETTGVAPLALCFNLFYDGNRAVILG